MKSLRSVLEEKFKDKKYEKDFYRGLEKTRVAVEITMHREKAGLTQEELADKLETSQSTIARLENPDYIRYSITSLRKIAEVLDLELVVSLRKKGEERYTEAVTKVYPEVPTVFWETNNDSYNISQTTGVM